MKTGCAIMTLFHLAVRQLNQHPRPTNINLHFSELTFELSSTVTTVTLNMTSASQIQALASLKG